MTQLFINREAELAFLEERHRSRKAELVVLSGRRRVGKTALVVRFLEHKHGLYFLASQEGNRENVRAFAVEAARLLGDAGFARAEYRDWEAVFGALLQHRRFSELEKAGEGGVEVDEFPFLIHGSPAIPSVFQRIWELLLKERNVMLVLLGSAIGVMEEKVLGPSSPLYGRRTGDWVVQPLAFAEARKFFPGAPLEEAMRIWFVLGGIPQYLLQFDQRLPLFGNIEAHVLRKGEYLYREAEVLLREEFREPRNYVLLMKAIAQGAATAGDLCNAAGMDKGMVSKYLDVLRTLRFIREELPVGSSRKFKRRWYAVADPYFAFWLRYVHPNRTDLEALRQKEVLASIKKDFPAYAGGMFERLVEELVRTGRLKIPFTELGRWWHKDVEIDLVTLDERTGSALFCECKWQERVDAEALLAQLKEKAKAMPWRAGRRREGFALFAKSFKNRPSGARLYDLPTLEKALADA